MKAAQALLWYSEKATSIARYLNAKPPNIDAATAVMTELSLDAGQRAESTLGDVRVRGVTRSLDSPYDVVVSFNYKPTDNDIRELHELLRGLSR